MIRYNITKIIDFSCLKNLHMNTLMKTIILVLHNRNCKQNIVYNESS